ncbi:succinylglutamate desuccinylase/aspartoacylase family protein [Pontibacter silvestris]|uniref:Succinylglutamate desuccinylase/aspartoacylase family protein n=1 Tax=Pontibacter silvestris TaxID=2305183 RepID=A0ABW4X1B6_9BACT|nr:M14 family metallopeptidase [Pontibacter silvestris]MCC9137559.1 M14 family metallopeptidase [Pontibacter silvestris]
MKISLLYLFILISVFKLTIAQANLKPFTFSGEKIKAGTKLSLLIPVVSGEDSTVIPVTVFHGAKKGPVLGITAGVHGLEYAPIMAAQQLPNHLDPARMSGTVILVHMANVPAFLQRSLMVNPVDGKNLNRVFPGKPHGSLTEQLAYVISNEIIARCDYFIDVHAGDANNDLRPYSGYYNYYDMPAVSEKARQMAVALGFDFIVQFGNQQSLTEESIYCSREATKRNIPAVDIECGRKGIVEEKPVLQIQQALLSLMRHLQLLEGKPVLVASPVMIAQRTSVESEHEGFFYSDLTSGDYVRKGMRLGYITDLFGNHVADVICPTDGVILYKTFNPPIKKGDGLFSIGHIN